MQRSLRLSAVLAALVSTACSDTLTQPQFRDVASSLGNIPNNPSMNYGKADLEFFEVCKTYVGGTGPAVTVTVAVNDLANTTYNVTLADGQCKDVWIKGGAAEQVTVTENVPAGYAASYVKEVVTRTDYTTSPSVTGNVASGLVSGLPGEGTLIRFINTLLPPPPPPVSCSLTLGYWKTHGEDWDEKSDGSPFLTTDLFYNSGKTYLEIMLTPPAGGNAYLQLAHQYIAAQLNVKGGSSGVAAVDAALATAATYFASAAPGTPAPTGATRARLLAAAATLANYNEGLIGPGHCS